MAKIDGGELVVRILEKAGVDCIFALHGSHIDPIFQACIDRPVRLIDARHEAAAGHAAEGYARAGRRLGVVAVTAGPGFTNVLTSLANAHVDRTPVLYIAGAAPAADVETCTLQSGLDQLAVAAPISKWAQRITAASEIPRLVAQAIRVATAGPAGPVYLEIPADVLTEKIDEDALHGAGTLQLDAAPAPHPGKIAAALAMLQAAARPAIVAGADVYHAGAWEELRGFAQATGIPVFTEYEALGTVASDDPLWAGTTFQLARLAPELHPDLVLALGVRFGWNVPGFRRTIKSRIIHIEIDPREIGRLRAAELGIVSGCREALVELLACAKDRSGPDRAQWRHALSQGMDAIRAEPRKAAAQAASGRLHPFLAAEAISSAARNATLIVDGAVIKHWLEDAVRRQNPGTYFTHGPFGTMGMGLGMAIGAKAARPDQPVLCVTGDGAAGFTIAEFDTMVRHDLPVVVVVVNNRSWAASQLLQTVQHGPNRVLGTALGGARYDEAARALGAQGLYVTRLAELEPAIEAALGSGKPACINCEVDLAPNFRPPRGPS